jgi:hypothetical protein
MRGSRSLDGAQRERKAVDDVNQRWRILGKTLHQPFGDAAPGPVFCAGMAAAGTSSGGASRSAMAASRLTLVQSPI